MDRFLCMGKSDIHSQAGIKTIYDDLPSTHSDLMKHINDLLDNEDLDEATKEALRKMMEEGGSPGDLRGKLAKLGMDRIRMDSFVENEAKKMLDELKRRWQTGDITEDEARDLQRLLDAPALTEEERLQLKQKLKDGSLTTQERKNILKALAGEGILFFLEAYSK